ncbi:MAG: GGDEF domain-containing protein, partial [Anaerolineales bacterium]
RAIRYQHPLSLILFDADHFKSINDTYGHPFGDQILISLVQLCEQNIRAVDIFARYGGEEFILLLPQTECEAALKIAERLRTVIENFPQTYNGERVHLTISVGLACWQPGEKITLAELVQQADEALYLSKQSGRNRVTRFHPPQS